MKHLLACRPGHRSRTGLDRVIRSLLALTTTTGTLASLGFAGDPPAADDYTAWIQQKFPSSYGNPALESSSWGDNADPDRDGCVNLMEFVMQRDPNTNDAHLGMTCRIDGSDLVATFRETTSTNAGMTWKAEWSVDVGFWNAAGIRYATIETHAGYRLVEARISRNREQVMFMRLSAMRQPWQLE